MTNLALMMVHAAYSFVLVYLGFPILKIHVELVLRNELAHEWKRNMHEVVIKNGKKVKANDLDEEEFNLLFDDFRYDPEMNDFDSHSSFRNCAIFWCTARWCTDNDGAF